MLLQLRTVLLLLWLSSFGRGFSPTTRHNSRQQVKSRIQGTPVDLEFITVGDEIGTGSYGTVHYCELEGKQWIGKRPLTKEEIQQKISSEADLSPKDLQAKVDRCQYYWDVEEHCYKKLGAQRQLPLFKGSFQDKDNLRWMLFEMVASLSSDNEPAPSLTDLMALDHEMQHTNTHPHHLYHLQQALGLGTSPDVSLGTVLDVFFQSLLTVLKDIHAKRIVHRDLKPGNLLVSNAVYLIDFGSAADLEPNNNSNNAPSKGRFFPRKYVGLQDNIVAISPVYSAPELFVDRLNKPENFDVFSAGLVYCQLLFALLDERTDAGFHQQLEVCNWDLDVWLQQELASKVRPKGLEEALVVLSDRPGLWRLLKEMFRVKPWDRISSKEALLQFQEILKGDDAVARGKEDGPFFQSVLETFELCDVLDEEEAMSPRISRPLHFVATFKRNTPLGLVLAEANADNEDDDEKDEDSRRKWTEATENALPGQVFVKGIVPGGQAESFGIFEIGDELEGVGELPIAGRGFEKVVDLLGKQPPSSKYVTLHFGRKKKSEPAPSDSAALRSPIVPQDSGAWSSKGRRKSQEDKFVLHEIQDTTGRSVLIAGVFDGHGGTAASKLAAEELPGLVSEQLFRTKGIAVEEILEKAWDTISVDYRQACVEGSCIADYDSNEGILDANTGAEDLVAGTTATVAALDESNGRISILNCGDSRTLLVDRSGRVKFETKDHTPEREMARLKAGKEQGLDYSIPQCSTSRWWLSVGDYQYAVGRSLEGPFATSKGIVSLPDVTTLQAEPGTMLVSASDGLWEVMDSGEVAHVVATLRSQRTSAGNSAKTLCSMAIEKGSSDNVSVVIVYLE